MMTMSECNTGNYNMYYLFQFCINFLNPAGILNLDSISIFILLGVFLVPWNVINVCTTYFVLQGSQSTLNQMKTIRQSKKSSKSVGSLFNQFNAFWALSYILINILALFLYMTTTNGFYKGVCFGLFISKNEF